ncbi:MAG TPA: hypothetical protein VI233_13745 [Puia sp.]
MKTLNYAKVNYSTEVEFSKSPAVVFTHIIELSKWWPEEFSGERIQLDSAFVCKTGDGHYSKNKVVEFVRDKKLVWLTTESLREADGYELKNPRKIFLKSSLSMLQNGGAVKT